MKRIAVTFSHNYSDLTDVWTNYYREFFDEIKIVDTGNSLAMDWGATVKHLNSLQDELFKEFDLILFADMDEIIVPDPDKYKDLGEYLDKVKVGAVRCIGYNVIEMEGDGPIDFSKPLVEQRTHWSKDPLFSKTVIITKPQHYVSNHAISNPVAPDLDLIMLHLRDMDLKTTTERNRKLGHEFSMADFLERRSRAELMSEKWRVL